MWRGGRWIKITGCDEHGCGIAGWWAAKETEIGGSLKWSEARLEDDRWYDRATYSGLLMNKTLWDYTFFYDVCIIPYWSLESFSNPHHLPSDSLKIAWPKTQLAQRMTGGGRGVGVGVKEKLFQTISICMLDIMSQWTVYPSLVRWSLSFGRCSEGLYPSLAGTSYRLHHVHACPAAELIFQNTTHSSSLTVITTRHTRKPWY